MPFDHFGLIAPLYNRQHEYSSIKTMIEVAALPMGGLLLDVGGGTGRVAAALYDQAGRIIIADPSLGMLRFAINKPGIQIIAACSENLPFPDGSFQRAIMVDALHHVVDQTSTARELLRVLEPGGRLVIEEPDIHTFGVKLIALVEKLLLMRSRFYSPKQIASFFPGENTSVLTNSYTAWVVIEK
jgi:demethylmenaquinone methyltransferase/2-methoxy-6-polyprenyl-1,4-benzoquinol methylase